MSKNRTIVRCRVFNLAGEPVEIGVRECTHVKVEFGVWIDSGLFSDGEDLKWVPDLHSALQIVAAEAELIALS